MNIFARGIITASAMVLGAGSLNAQDFILQAHRGLSDKFPENTSLAFFEAAKIPVYDQGRSPGLYARQET